MVRADRRNVERGEPLGGVARRNPGECLGLLVERHQGDDGQARGATHRLDGLDELVEVVERLDHEQVGAATLEHSYLLRERIASDAGRGRLSRGPMDPATNTSFPVTSRASRASFTADES